MAIDATNGSISYAASAANTGTNSFTVMAFASRGNNTGRREIISKPGQADGGIKGWALFFQDDSIRADLRYQSVTGGNSEYLYGYTASDYAYPSGILHIAATFDRANKFVQIYVNGAAVTTTQLLQTMQVSTSVTNANPLYVGLHAGIVFDARVYMALLTAEEIKAIATSNGAAILGRNTVFHMQGAGPEGSTAHNLSPTDISPNSYTATITSNPVFVGAHQRIYP